MATVSEMLCFMVVASDMSIIIINGTSDVSLFKVVSVKVCICVNLTSAVARVPEGGVTSVEISANFLSHGRNRK